MQLSMCVSFCLICYHVLCINIFYHMVNLTFFIFLVHFFPAGYRLEMDFSCLAAILRKCAFCVKKHVKIRKQVCCICLYILNSFSIKFFYLLKLTFCDFMDIGYILGIF